MNKLQEKNCISGRVFLVGAGPGDPRLFSERGKELLRQADVVIFDRLIPPSILEFTKPEAELIYGGKSPKKHTLKQEQIIELLIKRAETGKKVVRLKGGDPYIFGRGGEEAVALAEAGVGFEVVPGVTAAAGACAYAGIPLTHRGLAGTVTFITGHNSDKSEEGHDWEALARLNGTLVFYMTVKNLKSICQNLIDFGKSGNTPAAIIENGTLPTQRTLRGALQSISNQAASENIFPPALLVVGEVAGMKESLAWYEKLPIFSQKIVITRPAERAAEMARCVRELGGEPILSPAIKIGPPKNAEPLQAALQNLEEFDFVIFTSSAGVEAFFDQLREKGGDARRLGHASVGAIGPQTAAALRTYGISADLVPEKYTTEGLVKALTERQLLDGRKILCPRSNIAPPELIDMLSAGGAQVREVEAYSTEKDNSRIETVKKILQHGTETKLWLTFTSGSTAESFFSKISPSEISSKGASVASIGPHTSAALSKIGVSVDVEAKEHTAEGLITAITRIFH